MTYCLSVANIRPLLSLNQKAKFMYSYNDFERLFVRYQLEGISAGVSIEQFCMSNKVLYSYVGKYSLEFYIANLCIHCFLDLTTSIHIKSMIYILGNVLLALILIPLNQMCRKVLS